MRGERVMTAILKPLTTRSPDIEVDYPTSDGRPIGETDLHRRVMNDAIETLELYFADQQVYVSGNILLFYRPGNKRRHVSPDVLVVRDLDPGDRENYLLWKEGKSPNVVIEVTSKSTRDEDWEDKLEIYRDEIKVVEYFLFDPRSEYLNPSLQGYRLDRGRYQPIAPGGKRLPSEELGLHLEADGSRLRFFEPVSGKWLPTPKEVRLEAIAALQQKDVALQQKDTALEKKDAALRTAEAELERLRLELDALRSCTARG
jgi:Uma2 family endonuclease